MKTSQDTLLEEYQKMIKDLQDKVISLENQITELNYQLETNHHKEYDC